MVSSIHSILILARAGLYRVCAESIALISSLWHLNQIQVKKSSFFKILFKLEMHVAGRGVQTGCLRADCPKRFGLSGLPLN